MKTDKKLVIFILMGVLIFFIDRSGLFTNLFGINHPQSIALSVLIIAAFLWVTEWVPLYVTSLVILLLQIGWLLPVMKSGVGSADRQIYLSPFFSDIILLFLGGFVLAAMLHKYGLDNRVANWFLKRIGNKPSSILLGIMLISAVFSMWMSNTATAAMMFAIILPIIASIPESNTFSKGLAVSIPFACNLGGLGTPIGTPPNAIAMSYLSQKGMNVSFGGWMVAAVPLMLVLLVVVWFTLMKMFPPGDLKIEFNESKSTPMRGVDWIIIALFGVTVLGWLTTNNHGFSTGTVSLIPIIATFGFGLLDNRDFKALPWDVLFMVGGGLCLGVGLEQSGLTSEIVGAIPLEISFVMVLISFLLLSAVMTTFMSNTATANLLIPIAISLNFQASTFVIPIAMVCSTAMALPISTPPNAIAFGSGLLESKDMMRPGLVITVVSLVIILLVAKFYLPYLGI